LTAWRGKVGINYKSLQITADGLFPFNHIPSINATVNAATGTIRRLRGILKRKPGEKPFAGQMAEHKRREKKLEEPKLVRNTRA
jgi:hypothetical protein